MRKFDCVRCRTVSHGESVLVGVVDDILFSRILVCTYVDGVQHSFRNRKDVLRLRIIPYTTNKHKQAHLHKCCWPNLFIFCLNNKTIPCYAICIMYRMLCVLCAYAQHSDSSESTSKTMGWQNGVVKQNERVQREIDKTFTLNSPTHTFYIYYMLYI